MTAISTLSVRSVLGACATALALSALPAWAGKPEWIEQGQHGRQDDHPNKRDHGGRDERRDRDDRRDDRDHRRDERHSRDDDRYRHDDRRAAPSGYSVQVGAGGVTVNIGGFFGDSQRRFVHDYYAPQIASGKCPPGLAKKHNGCLPPGQAKKWQLGQRLPRDVVTYPIPSDLRRRLGTPPAGHEFVRVAGDILLIAVGTSMVVDAIEDLTR
jgi:Ni/Co efflux regulator RcnB